MISDVQPITTTSPSDTRSCQAQSHWFGSFQETITAIAKQQFTIYTVISNERIQELRESRKEWSNVRKIAFGIGDAASRFVTQMIAGGVIFRIASLLFDTDNVTTGIGEGTPLTFLAVVLKGPVAEELIFRGLLQNAIYLIQEGAKRVAPESLTENHIFVWLTSDSCRIIATNLTFAAVHMMNAGLYLSTAGAISQVAVIVLFASQSLTYETTGDLGSAMSSHIANNFIAYCLMKLVS